MGKVRMADIAAKVGVSTVTVHNALAGNKGVSDEMREKIQKVADELGYHQMTAAANAQLFIYLRIFLTLRLPFSLSYVSFPPCVTFTLSSSVS